MLSWLSSCKLCAPLAPVGLGSIDVDEYARQDLKVVLHGAFSMTPRPIDVTRSQPHIHRCGCYGLVPLEENDAPPEGQDMMMGITRINSREHSNSSTSTSTSPSSNNRLLSRSSILESSAIDSRMERETKRLS